MKSCITHQRFNPGVQITDWRKPVHCQSSELETVIEAGRAAGHGMTEIKTVKREFVVHFQPVTAYQTTNQPCN